MGLHSKTGVRGLYFESTYIDGAGRQVSAKTPGAKTVRRYRIDLRWTDAKTGQPRRHKERLPLGLPATAAKTRAQSVLAAALGGTLPTKGQAAPRTLRAAFNAYLEWVQGAGSGEYVDAERAHVDKSLHCNTWIKVVGDLPLTALGLGTFDKFKAARSKDVGPATINRALTTMKHFLRWAAARDWVDKAHAALMRTEEIKLLPEPAARLRWLKDGERAKLESKLPPELKALALAAAFSGLRLGNVVRMQKSDVDLQHRTLSAWVKRKGQRKRIDLPVNDALAGILDAAMKRSKGAYVFANHRGQPYTMRGASSFFRKRVTAAGITDFSFHDLRHDYATRLRRRGVPLEDIQELLGHADIKMTGRYAHVGAERLRAAVATLDIAPPLPPAAKKPRKRKR